MLSWVHMGSSSVDLKDVITLSRLALSGRSQDIQLFIRRLARDAKDSHPELASQLTALLQDVPSIESPFRSSTVASVPVDTDSRLRLVKCENPVQLDIDPIWPSQVRDALTQVLIECREKKTLLDAGLTPTRSMLFTGAPGVGKTLGARWLAFSLQRPLLTLDLSAVMSSFLGRTGANVKHVFEYAKGVDCVLLIDEFDAIGKRRDDVTELGELKRLVTVLLQEIDDWPPYHGLLLASTNHSELLDPAIWRRFDAVVEFPMPAAEQVKEAVTVFLGTHREEASEWIDIIAAFLCNASYSEIERELVTLRRNMVLHKMEFRDAILRWTESKGRVLPKQTKKRLATELMKAGYSQRRASEITGISRVTIRKTSRRH
jgi:SpoVK/Ycf46/Vps4 family AAA+-type ATPase